MDHYVPRNSPGTPQFLIRGSEGVGWGGAGWDVFLFLYLIVFSVSYSVFVVFYKKYRPRGVFSRPQNDSNTIPKLS